MNAPSQTDAPLRADASAIAAPSNQSASSLYLRSLQDVVLSKETIQELDKKPTTYEEVLGLFSSLDLDPGTYDLPATKRRLEISRLRPEEGPSPVGNVPEEFGKDVIVVSGDEQTVRMEILSGKIIFATRGRKSSYWSYRSEQIISQNPPSNAPSEPHVIRIVGSAMREFLALREARNALHWQRVEKSDLNLSSVIGTVLECYKKYTALCVMKSISFPGQESVEVNTFDPGVYTKISKNSNGLHRYHALDQNVPDPCAIQYDTKHGIRDRHTNAVAVLTREHLQILLDQTFNSESANPGITAVWQGSVATLR